MTKSIVIKASVRWALQALCCCLAVHGLAAAQRPLEVPSYESLLDPTLVTLHVAEVGPVSITGIEFKLSYEFGPAFVKRVSDSKLRCLNFMINEKLLALDAQRRGLGAWPDVQRQVAEIEADLATEELYKRDVLKGVRVTDRQIAQGVALERVQLAVQWIFTRTAGEMDECIRRLRSGVPFDSLYAGQLRQSPQLESERSMTTTRFKLRMKNPMLAGIVDTMTAGTISLPVHGPDGWYLVRTADVSTNPLMTQTESIKLAEEVRRTLIQHISDSLSDRYVGTLVASRRPTILREPFNALVAHLGKRYLDSARYHAWNLAALKGARRIPDAADLGAIAADTLVRMNKGRFSVQDFLEWFRLREPYATLTLSSPAALSHAVEEMVWRMVRDRLLTERAFARGFQRALGVKQQTAWWKNKMLYTANRNRIGDTIVDSLPALRSYYENNQRRYADSLGRVRSFADAREDVWRDYYAQELTRKLLHEILRLRQQYGVKVDADALAKIPVDEEHNPKAIDVYPVKKGGIYPHAAFPSIDYDWQTWN